MKKKGDARERRGSTVKCRNISLEGGTFENLMGLSMYEGHMETAKYICMNIEKLQYCTPSA